MTDIPLQIMVKIDHKSTQVVKIVKIIFEDELGNQDFWMLTPSHFVNLFTKDGKEHIPARKARVGDSLIRITANGPSLARIVEISTSFVPQNELVQIYTSSCTFIANGLLASCKVEGDASVLFIPALSFISNYISK